ncbi:hypothetical protein GUJ93_ZPchr0009g591 [Zizania palustris]|uniref:Uncharacterized protein n=1 Tax=Zizania palustris TaxID=103762 RepID=A0A8J5RQG0_ZIZPA|nr:hypothetical protein GUJ93_ZPchr0009g591 [Zizania palustris]
MPCPACVGGSAAALPCPVLPSAKPYPLQHLPPCAAVLPPASLARSAWAAVDADNAPCVGLARPLSGGEQHGRKDACGYG